MAFSGKTMTIAVLYSGGLDSFIAYKIAPKDKLAIWVNLGQPYANKEELAIDKHNIPVKKIKISNLLPKKPKIDDWIIPGRNLLLVTIAAMYGDEVWLSALDGEMHKFAKEKDKSPEFFHLSSGLLTYVFDIKRNETIVHTPFKNLTKSEVVALALKKGITKKELINTSTCYHNNLSKCGLCGSCFKRWIAFTNNGIDEIYSFKPWENEYAQRTIEDMKIAKSKQDYSHYSLKRITETFNALKVIK